MKHFVRAGFGLLWLALVTVPAMAGLFDRFGSSPQEKILEADQAFRLTIDATDPQTLEARWLIAPGYYLYRDKFRLSIPNAPGIRILSTDIAPGEPKDDPHFGRQEIYHNEAVLVAHLQRDPASADAQDLSVKADYQGCAEVGVCYPPLSQTVSVSLAALAPPTASTAAPGATTLPMAGTAQGQPPATPTGSEAEQDRLARLLGEQRFLAIPAFFGFGLLLAFTPCIFPMIPILSSLIAGQGAHLTRRRALLLSLTYVLAMAVTYTVAGVLAALLGQNVQAWFQSPWVIGAFSGLFILLALSMFGLYELQVPGALQNRLVAWSNRQRGGHLAGVAIMGLLSALIVGPCVAPPLIGALSFIAVTGDVLLGAAALFALSLGMGTPLLIIGTSAGHWLPRAGHWMERTKSVFGVLLLAVALWLLERILPVTVTMVSWATLLIVTATYMGALQPAVHGAPAWRTLIKGLGLVLLIYGILLLVGVAAGGRDPWQPLRGIGLVANATGTAQQPRFRTVKTVAEVEQAVSAANGRPVMLDFYADWCVSCKEMERDTFTDPSVQSALADLVTLRADVTANDAADQALLKHFGLIGPPAILFFGPDGQERSALRVVGFLEATPFAAQLRALPREKS